MTLRVNSKVRLIDKVDFSERGDTGTVVEIHYGPTFDTYTVLMDKGLTNTNKLYQDSLLEGQLQRIPGDRKEGERIEPDDIMVGDKIQALGSSDRGVERPTIGVVRKIKEDPISIGKGDCKKYTHLIFETSEGGVIYSTWWANSGRGHSLTLLEAAEELHPVDAAEEGDFFVIGEKPKSHVLYRKYKGKIWIREHHEEGKDPYAHVRYAPEVRNIFDDWGSVMQKK